ncbi:MAG: DMT family transporter [Actinomycetota bacterium]
MTSTAARNKANPLAGRSETGLGFVGAAIAVTAWGSSGVIVKWISMGALAIIVYRFAFYSILVGGLRALQGQPLTWYAFRRSILGGLLLAADVAFFFTAVKVTSVVNATIIGSLQPLLLTAYGVRFLGERVERRDVLLGGLALAGAIVIVAAGGSAEESNIWGDLAALGALTAWSSYFVVAKKVNAEIAPTDFTISAAIIVALANVPLALIFGQSLAWPSTSDALWVLLMAIGAGVLGHNLMNWSLPRIPLWLGSTFTLFVPVVSSTLAWVFLDEALNAWQIFAMAVTVGALGLLVLFQTQTEDTVDEDIAEEDTADGAAAGGVAP